MSLPDTWCFYARQLQPGALSAIRSKSAEFPVRLCNGIDPGPVPVIQALYPLPTTPWISGLKEKERERERERGRERDKKERERGREREREGPEIQALSCKSRKEHPRGTISFIHPMLGGCDYGELVAGT